jgi:cytochrome c
MFTRKSAAGALLACTLLGGCATGGDTSSASVPQQGPNLGVTPSAAMLAAMDISIPPSGAGLPAGGADARDGAKVYAAKCASCHGVKGEGKPADRLVGGIGTLTKERIRTVGSYWPYATTLFDYTRRAMPTTAPMTLTNEEVYGVTAYVLFLNGIIRDDEVMNAQSLPRVRMPNREGFVDYSNK